MAMTIDVWDVAAMQEWLTKVILAEIESPTGTRAAWSDER
jgi:hypothetical protein